MHINSLGIKNFRNFDNTTISFKEGINVVIGPNNAGKTNLLKAISFLRNRPKLKLTDFNYNNLFDEHKITYKEVPPKIEFSYVIGHSFNTNEIDSAIVKLKNFIIYESDGNLLQEGPAETYKIKGSFKIIYSLDEKYNDEYKKRMFNIDNGNELTSEEYFKAFENLLEEFLDKYEWNYYNHLNEPNVTSSDIENIFNIDFIPADRTTDKLLPETKKFIKAKINQENSTLEIKRNISDLMKVNFQPITDEIKTKFAAGQDDIGITNGNNILEPSFRYDAALEECFHFHLIDKDKGYNLPLENNGLGYNNLIQIYNILQFKISDDYNILLIEEPEAHLHPAMQYQLFKFLQKLEEESSENIKNQIVITTHSPNISASSNIDDIITLHYHRNDGNCCVFAENLKEKFISPDKSKQERLDYNKKHLAKFLDVTRSDMLFTERVILVEGLAEKLLLPFFANKNPEIDLINRHISIVEVGGINFHHFLTLFNDTKNKILCIRDCDIEYLNNCEKYQARVLSTPRYYKNTETIKTITQKNGGSTFENELFIDNFTDDDMEQTKETVCKKLLSMVLPTVIINTNLLKSLSIDLWVLNINEIKRTDVKNKIEKLLIEYKEKFDECVDINQKNKINTLFFANLFLTYAKNKKGAVALNILMSKFADDIKVPEYIQEGLEWLIK